VKSKHTVIITISLLLLVCPLGAAGQDFLLYANNYSDSLNIALAPIGMNLMGWLTGLDYPDEWVEYDIEPQSFGTYEIRMAARGAENVEYHLELTLFDLFGGEQQTIQFDFIGLGFGSCSCNILTVGGDELGMHSPSYKARLTMHSTGELWIYSLTLPVLTSSKPNSWGGIKSLYGD
jgi:hypothetical protein